MKHDDSPHGNPNRYAKISRFVFFGFVAVAAYFLITEHRAHLSGILPFLLIAACPLLHLFHHRGHRHGGDGENDGENKDRSPPDTGSSAHLH